MILTIICLLISCSGSNITETKNKNNSLMENGYKKPGKRIRISTERFNENNEDKEKEETFSERSKRVLSKATRDAGDAAVDTVADRMVNDITGGVNKVIDATENRVSDYFFGDEEENKKKEK